MPLNLYDVQVKLTDEEQLGLQWKTPAKPKKSSFSTQVQKHNLYSLSPVKENQPKSIKAYYQARQIQVWKLEQRT